MFKLVLLVFGAQASVSGLKSWYHKFHGNANDLFGSM